MEEFDWKAHGLTDPKELEEMDARMKKTEEEGIKNTLKHFDKIHDRLFQFNNLLVAGYFTLSKFESSVSLFTILIPITNLFVLLRIEYKMMEKSRFESNITQKTPKEIDEWGNSIKGINNYSLLTIFTTSVVTVIFLYLFLFR